MIFPSRIWLFAQIAVPLHPQFKGCSLLWAEMIPSNPDSDNADVGMDDVLSIQGSPLHYLLIKGTSKYEKDCFFFLLAMATVMSASVNCQNRAALYDSTQVEKLSEVVVRGVRAPEECLTP